MPVESTQLVASDGRALAAKVYRPDGPARATLALLPAWAVRQRYYARFATFLSTQGFTVLTFDPRGIGASADRPTREETVTTTEWATLDHRAALGWLYEQPGPHLAVGHSFGGQILGILDEASDLDGLYAVAAQLGYWGHWDGWQRHRMRFLFSVVMPAATRTFGYLPGWTGMGEDVPGPALLEWASWLRSPGYLLDHVDGASARFARVQAPVSFLGFTDDDYAPPRGVQAIAACLPASHTTTRILAPRDVGLGAIGHFGFFRPHDASVLWNDAVEHLDRWAEAASPP